MSDVFDELQKAADKGAKIKWVEKGPKEDDALMNAWHAVKGELNKEKMAREVASATSTAVIYEKWDRALSLLESNAALVREIIREKQEKADAIQNP